MGRTVPSDEEDDEIEVGEEEDPRPSNGGDDGDDDEGEDGLDEYENDSFIADSDDEEGNVGGEEEVQKSNDENQKKNRKKKRESEGFMLDEDDYMLLEDNNVTGINRPKPGNKFKRLKKARKESEMDQHSVFSDDDGTGTKDSGNGRDALPFEDYEDDQQAEETEELGNYEDDLEDFIVDDDEIDGNDQVVRRMKVKKKVPRQTAGVSSSAVQEAQEIFGEVDDLLARRKQGLEREASNSGELRGKRLEDEFEPFILEEKYMTTKDEQIKENELPERVQLSEELTGDPPTDNTMIEEESLWIYSQLTGDGFMFFFGDELNKDIHQKDIANVLTMLHVKKFEIPFIAMYRKEKCSSLLKNLDSYQGSEYDMPKMKWHKLLWAVQTLDRKWLLLQKRKVALELYYKKRFDDEKQKIEDVTRQELNSQLYNSIIEALRDAKSDKELDDVDAKFNLHFPPGEVEEGQFKRPKRNSFYRVCHKAGLWEVAKQFGHSSEQFGDHLTLTKILDVGELDSRKDSPEVVAANFTCAMFEMPQDVLRGARHMAAVEISREPIVRKHIRGIFMNKAVVSTCPTPEGNTIIDPYHQLYGVKWLREKPLDKFVDAQWLLIQKAEQENLLKVTVKLLEDAKNELISDAHENYLSDCVSKSAQSWDEQRKMILDDAFFSFLLPSMEKEARSLLTAKAKHWLHMEYGKQLWNKVTVAPWKKKNDADIDLDDESELRVMACCSGPGKPSTTFVMLDSFGELVDVLHVGSISNRSQGVTEEQKKKNGQQRQQLLKFMTDNQPHVVCVGASNYNCRQLKDDIYEVIYKGIVEDNPRDVIPHMKNLSIVYGDESVPRLYENSRISSDQLPGHSGIVKRAVALGRYLQNPLAMIATLCGPGKEILSWKLHALEQFLTPDEKYEVVEQVMVDATNQIGFDINLASSHEWHFSTLQFISGLGPRKASGLKKDLVREGSIFSRKDLVEPLGRKVFMNASGFLRVRRSGAAAAAASPQIIDMLEDTRIHPESYALAKKLAKDIYAEDAPHEINEMDDDEQELAIEHIRERPHFLQNLDIDEYIKSIPEEYRKKETLCGIQTELLCGFSDWRTPYIEPSPDEEFWMLSGETEDTISEGRIVQVTVRNIQENKIVCMFDSGLKAIVMADDYSDKGFDPESLHEGGVLTGKICNVNKNRFMVHLTCKASEMRGKPFSRGDQDPYYHEQDMTSQTAQDKARKHKELAKKHFQPRIIVHPHFKNLTAEEAMQFLSDKEPGEKVIRASSRGPSFLTLTLKIADGVYAHKEISEGGKDHKDIANLLRLGKTLTIDNETFEDLDEVIDRYVDPLVGHLKSMLCYRKFRMGLKNEVDEMLRAEKAENPMRIVYSFGISHEHPGTFILSYIQGTNPHHEYVGLYPKGFRFRKRDFDNIDRLVSYFQKNIDKRPPVAEPSMRNVAAMVPMKNSACSSGAGAGDVNDGSRGDGSCMDRPLSGRLGRRFDSRNSSGGKFDNDNNGGGGNSGGWASNIGSSRGGLGTGGNSGSTWGGVSTGGGSGGRNAAGWGGAGGDSNHSTSGGGGVWGSAANPVNVADGWWR